MSEWETKRAVAAITRLQELQQKTVTAFAIYAVVREHKNPKLRDLAKRSLKRALSAEKRTRALLASFEPPR